MLVVALGLSSTFTFAQSNLLNAKTPDQIGQKTEAELVADNDKLDGINSISTEPKLEPAGITIEFVEKAT